jgi:hypothetical protein
MPYAPKFGTGQQLSGNKTPRGQRYSRISAEGQGLAKGGHRLAYWISSLAAICSRGETVRPNA